MDTKRNYTLSGAAKVLGVKVRTVRQWVKDGKIKATKYEISNRWFISEEEIERVCSNVKKS